MWENNIFGCLRLRSLLFLYGYTVFAYFIYIFLKLVSKPPLQILILPQIKNTSQSLCLKTQKNINTIDAFVSERIGTNVALQSILSPFSQFRRNHISHHFCAGTGRHPTHADTPPDPPPQTWAPGAGLWVFNFKYKAI